jgi:hypothetical protein
MNPPILEAIASMPSELLIHLTIIQQCPHLPLKSDG